MEIAALWQQVYEWTNEASVGITSRIKNKAKWPPKGTSHQHHATYFASILMYTVQ